MVVKTTGLVIVTAFEAFFSEAKQRTRGPFLTTWQNENGHAPLLMCLCLSAFVLTIVVAGYKRKKIYMKSVYAGGRTSNVQCES